MRTLPTLPITVLWLLTPLLGCPTTPAKDDTSASDTDTDTDSDSDTDSDTDADTPAYDFTGTVALTTTLNGLPDCNTTAAITGTPYTGDCLDCDFAVAVTSAITTDDSAETCTYWSNLSLISPDGDAGLALGHADEYYLGYYTGYQDNALFAGYGYPYWYGLSYNGSEYGTFTRTGDDISWTFSAASTYTYFYDYNQCDGATESDAARSFGGTGAGSTLNCDGTTTDVWTFTADGSAVSVTVDTVAADSAFDPVLWVNDPDMCSVVYADDNFDCTFPPADYQCPSFQLDSTTAGTYQVVVKSWGSCTGDSAAYQLTIDGGADLTLAVDDATSGYPYTVDIAGSGTLTAAAGE
jgi:hypothetical protein